MGSPNSTYHRSLTNLRRCDVLHTIGPTGITTFTTATQQQHRRRSQEWHRDRASAGSPPARPSLFPNQLTGRTLSNRSSNSSNSSVILCCIWVSEALRWLGSISATLERKEGRKQGRKQGGFLGLRGISLSCSSDSRASGALRRAAPRTHGHPKGHRRPSTKEN